MIINLAAGITLTTALFLSLLFSSFMVFVALSSQQVRSGTTLLIIQLGSTNGILAILFLAFSTPSILQGKWLTPVPEILTNKLKKYIISSDDGNISSSFVALRGNNFILLEETENFTAEDLFFEFKISEDSTKNDFSNSSESDEVNININRSKSDEESRNEIWFSDVRSSRDSNASINEVSIGQTLPDDYQRAEGASNGEGVFCQIYGWLLILLHVASIWMVVGLQCDKFIAISSPLRYNILLTRNRVAIYSVVVWIIAFTTATTPLLAARIYVYVGGACLPAWHVRGSLPYTVSLAVVMLFIPGCLILIINIRIILIARHHQHRIFSAIFEVMMSAQATVTHQKNPFDVAPKKTQKSTRSVVEQLLAFGVCYAPIFILAVCETVMEERVNSKLEIVFVGLFLASPLVNSFLYGVKCKSLRKSFKNYLRRRLYKSEVRSEIEARCPSGQNSRRPSISSSIAMPFLQRTLKRRMSDHLINDPNYVEEEIKMVRRSSDLSWHPLDDDTPSPQRLRKGLEINIGGLGGRDPKSVSQYLTVPSFEMARCYQSQQERSFSITSLESEVLNKDNEVTEDEGLTTPDGSPMNFNCEREEIRELDVDQPLKKCNSLDEGKFSVLHESNSCNNITAPTRPLRSSLNITSNPCTPLLISAYTKMSDTKPVNTSSPYIMQTLDALMSIGLSQSLLKFSTLWKSKSSESFKGSAESVSKSTYVAVPIEIVETPSLSNGGHEMATFSYKLPANSCAAENNC